MKIQLLARPDHSLYLYNFLKKLIDIQLITYKVAKKNSLLHRIRPVTKLVDKNVIILDDLTFFEQFVLFLSKRISINPYKWEANYAEFAYRRAAKHFHPDLIHYWPVYCHYFAKKQREQKNIQTIADVYSAYPHYVLKYLEPEYEKYQLDIKTSYILQDMERNTEFLEHENSILTNSNYVKQSILAHHPAKNIFVAEYGFLGDPRSFDYYQDALAYKEHHQSQKLRLVYVGTVSIEKGVPYLLEALKKMNSTTIELDVIGPIKHGQEKIFRSYSNVKGINFVGKKANIEIKNTLKKYSVLVLPSLSDAYSLAVIEGLQNALPVIVTDRTGNKDAIQKFKVGEVVPAGDTDSLITAIEKMIDRPYRSILSRNIGTFIKSDEENPYPAQVLKVYESLISSAS